MWRLVLGGGRHHTLTCNNSVGSDRLHAHTSPSPPLPRPTRVGAARMAFLSHSSSYVRLCLRGAAAKLPQGSQEQYRATSHPIPCSAVSSLPIAPVRPRSAAARCPAHRTGHPAVGPRPGCRVGPAPGGRAHASPRGRAAPRGIPVLGPPVSPCGPRQAADSQTVCTHILQILETRGHTLWAREGGGDGGREGGGIRGPWLVPIVD